MRRLLIETHESGFLAKRLRQEGETVPVDLAIAVFCEEAEHVEAFADYKSTFVPRGAASALRDGRLFCWQAYLKEGDSGTRS
jgi:pyruvate/2-oxoglutarate dehydrogenase complex dihydrolipoamide acyltransferase (E2) component